MPKRVPITLACGDYDRTSALVSGEIDAEGVDLTWLTLPVEETFFRMLRYREFDAAEMSLSSYVMTLQRDAPFIAIPVFPSRAFRHNAIYVSPGSGIAGPARPGGGHGGVAAHRQCLDQRHSGRTTSRPPPGTLLPHRGAARAGPSGRRVMGTDFWTYGLAGNEDTLRTFLRYAAGQGLISGQPEPATLFAPETLEAYVI